MSNNYSYILITGGLGFIGSHVAVEVLLEKHKLIIIDNLSNSKRSKLDDIKKLGESSEILFFENDLSDANAITKIFNDYDIKCVIHLAGLKAVSESINFPLSYYINNVGGTMTLLNAMNQSSCKKIVFSSSATVYGDQKYPVDENCQIGNKISSPYGKTKCMIEQILTDLYNSDPEWQIIIFRYFNPVGNHPSGLLNENPNGIPNNLFPYIIKTANKLQKELLIYGKDYETHDGTCIRDFIHVVDLAKGHILPIKKINSSGLYIYNLGTGKGTSVLDLVKQFSLINNIDLPYQIVNRRQGDLPIISGIVEKINTELGWKAEKSINDVCRDAWINKQ